MPENQTKRDEIDSFRTISKVLVYVFCSKRIDFRAILRNTLGTLVDSGLSATERVVATNYKTYVSCVGKSIPASNMMRTKRVPVDEHLLSDRLTDYDKKMGRASSSTSLHSIGSSEQASELFNLKEHNEALEQAFPRVVPEPVLIDHVAEVIEKHGFTGSTAINLVSCCRDELCRPFTEYLDNKWGLPSFNIASLAGMTASILCRS